jgi:predicted Zn-dependent peptidase
MRSVEVTEIGGGLRVASEYRPDVHGVAFGVWVRVGSRDEDASSGVSHLIEHLLFRGTARHSALEIAETFDRLGTDLHASTGREETDIYSRVLAEDLPTALDIVGAMVAAPTLTDLEQERDVILEELALYDDTPDELVHDVLYGALFPDQAIGRPIAGTQATVASMSPQVVAGHHRRYYGAGGTVIAAAGALRHDELLELVTTSFDGYRGGTVGERERARPVEGETRFVVRDTEQVHIALGAPALDRHDDRRFAMAVLDQILGGGASSRLFQEIREHHGLVYTIYSYVTMMQETGVLGIATGTRPENAEEVFGRIGTALRDFARGVFDVAEVERAKESMRRRLLLSLDSTGARMARLGRSLVADVELLDDDEIRARIDAVGVDDLRLLAEEFLDPARFTVAGVGDDEPAFRRGLEAFRSPAGAA